MITRRLILATLSTIALTVSLPEMLCGSETHPWIEPAKRLQEEAVKQLCERYSLEPIGTGGMLMEGVKSLSLDFQASKELTHEEARRLVVLCVEEFRALINADAEIKPYLKEHPCPQPTVAIAISSPCRANTASSLPYVSIAWTVDDQLCVAFDDAKSEKRTFKQVTEEPYEEALAAVKAQEKKQMAQAATANEP